MFGRRFWPTGYWGVRYWPTGTAGAPAPIDEGDTGDRVILDQPRPWRRPAQPLRIPALVAGEFLATLPRPTVQLEGEVEEATVRGTFQLAMPRPIAEAVGIVGDGDDTLRELVELAVAAAGDAWLDG